jgi:hypothetical protein
MRLVKMIIVNFLFFQYTKKEIIKEQGKKKTWKENIEFMKFLIKLKK